MKLRIRRTLLIAGVLISLVVGLVSIRVASHLTALAAAPTAPPVSLNMLRDELAAERARSAALEQQLNDLLNASGELMTAIDAASEQVSTDGLTADELRARLSDAQARLNSVSALLAAAEARLNQINNASGSGGTGSATPPPGTAATPPPSSGSSGVTLTLQLVSGGVQATWTACPSSGFASAALVRSTDSEIHYPPEDGDTVVAQTSSLSVTTANDAGAPSGTLTYRLYCLRSDGGELKTISSSSSVSISVP